MSPYGQADFLGLELSGLLSALARVSHQIFKKKPMTKTRIANAPTKGGDFSEAAIGDHRWRCDFPERAREAKLYLFHLRYLSINGANYSYRKASIGSTRIARRAGI